MSAIGAIFTRETVPRGQLDTMANSLGKVPHDQSGTWASGPVGLAAAVLHTTAESREQEQPLASEDGRLAIVFDGYLLNPDEVGEQVAAKGAVLRGRSDAELVLRAYEVWGDECALRLEGEFSLIIADLRVGRLFVARDHLGFLPLYYREEQGRLIVASDFRTIAALSETPLEPNHLYLAQAIANRWCLREDTPWLGVKRALRAHVLSYDGERIANRAYWEPPTEVTIRYQRQEEYVEHYREVLLDCLSRASRSDRPVGVAVSGGLDSSALFCLADRLERDGEWCSPGFAGYSLAAEEGGNAFELPYARAAARQIGRPLTEVPLFDPDIDWYTEDGRWHYDMPIPSNGAMMLDMDRRVVADGSRVLINGSGGDEWLQGNAQYYREFVADADVRGFWQALSRDADAFGWSGALRQALRQASAELTPTPLREAIRQTLLKPRRKSGREPSWLAPHLRAALAEAEDAYGRSLPVHGVEWAKHNLVKSPFSDLTNSMMRRQRARIGLESRHPMLSRAFIEFSLKTPGHIKRQGAVTKVVHRRAMEGILPREILDRKTKANFTNARIDSQFADYVRAHADERLAELCDRQGLDKILAIDFSAPEGDYWAWEIWGLYASAAFPYQ
ncbi:MAG: asparagine synthetase B family protein [Erythrobacter sp.]